MKLCHLSSRHVCNIIDGWMDLGEALHRTWFNDSGENHCLNSECQEDSSSIWYEWDSCMRLWDLRESNNQVLYTVYLYYTYLYTVHEAVHNTWGNTLRVVSWQPKHMSATTPMHWVINIREAFENCLNQFEKHSRTALNCKKQLKYTENVGLMNVTKT